jgi:glycerol-3-phosphate acyltransferase PlsY
MDVLSYGGIAVLAYFLGSIPTGYLAGRLRGIDIRKVGSGNIGATNVLRTLGKRAGIAVLAFDAFKGFAACRLLPMLFETDPSEPARIVAGFCAILGHNYTCWLTFKGGKGIATSAGVLLGLMPWALAIVVAVWWSTVAVTRYVSIGSITAAAILPLAAWLTQASNRMIAVAALVGALAIYKHKTNIRRLLNGTELRFKSEDRVPKSEVNPSSEIRVPKRPVSPTSDIRGLK